MPHAEGVLLFVKIRLTLRTLAFAGMAGFAPAAIRAHIIRCCLNVNYYSTTSLSAFLQHVVLRCRRASPSALDTIHSFELVTMQMPPALPSSPSFYHQ